MDAILGIELHRAGEHLGRLVQPVLDRVDRRRQVGEALVLLVPPALAADLQGLRQVPPVLLVERLEVGIGRGALLAAGLLAADRQELAGAVLDLRAVAQLDGGLEALGRLLPVLGLEGGEPLGQGVESGVVGGGLRR